MPIVLRQSAVATDDDDRTLSATFSATSLPGSLLLLVGVITHSSDDTSTISMSAPSGWTLIRQRSSDELTVAVWYRQAAPATSAAAVSASKRPRSILVRLLEFTGIAQASALDRVTLGSGHGSTVFTGYSGTTAQADELIFAVAVNRYSSTRQSGFSGGLSKLYDTTSDGDHDDHRSRITVHGGVTSQTGNYYLAGSLSANRDWVAILATFRGGTTGPVRATSLNQAPLLDTSGGFATPTVFGSPTSVNPQVISPYLRTSGGFARIAPFDHQYLIGGYRGLLIGQGTPYNIESHEGLEGWELRTSDDDLARGDGAHRGVDLQSARQVMFKLNMPGPVEALLEALYRSLVPRRDQDFDLMWRHPDRSPRLLRCRPINLLRNMDWRQVLLGSQAFVLRAADPRHYGLVERGVEIPVAPPGATVVPVVSAVNAGNARAYPVIRVVGPPSGEPVQRVEVVNAAADVTFDVVTVLPPGAVLIGDMPARVTAVPRSPITLDGASKYGSWQFPREPFHLSPDPEVPGGVNALFARTTPAGAAVTVSLSWRDTWSG